MNVRDEIMNILGDNAKTDLIMKLMTTPMQKYRQTEPGRVAQKKAVAKFETKKQEKVSASAEFIEKHLQSWRDEKRIVLLCMSEDPDVRCKLPGVVISMSDMWQNYLETLAEHDGPKLTRAQYCANFPKNIERCNYYIDSTGRKHYNIDSACITV